MKKHKLYREDDCSFDTCEVLPEKNSTHPALLSDSNITPLKEGTTFKKRQSLTKTCVVKRKKTENDFTNSETSQFREVSSPSSIPCSPPKDVTLSNPSDFEDDALETDFFFKSNHKLPYSRSEDEIIVKFVLKGQNIFKVTSILLWKNLESKQLLPKRTYQSLKNRFLRNIKPYLFTRFQHLIKNETTKQRILAKYPDLKKTIGSTPALVIQSSNLSQSPVPINRKTTPLRAVKPSESPTKPLHFVVINSLFKKNSTFHKETKIKGSSVTISVTFHEPIPKSEPPFEPLWKKFEKIVENNKSGRCPTCGRFNNIPILNESSGSETEIESDNLIPNSVDVENVECKERCSSEKSKSVQEGCKADQGTENVISNNSEDFDKDLAEAEIHKFLGSENSNSIKEELDSDNTMDIDETVIPKTEPETSPEKDYQESSEETDVEVVYLNMASGFRKLIDDDEEKKLSRKCLFKNREIMGFHPGEDKNLDSYFLESSAEMETPTLTNDFETQAQCAKKTPESENSSGGSLMSNMMKMLSDNQ